MKIRVHRVPHSTNVERVALGAGIKGVAVDWVDHPAADRSAIRALSGQALVPIAEFDGEVIVDSIEILRRLEAEAPDPPLWPPEGPERNRAETQIAWFNDVWKLAPNALAAAGDAGLDAEEVAAHVASLRGSLPVFDSMLGARPFFAGPEAGIEDITAYPFLRYRRDRPGPEDGDPFHAVLHEHLRPGTAPRIDAWLERMAAVPQA